MALSSTAKVMLLGFLCATAIVLGSGIITLTVVLHKRKEAMQARRLAKGLHGSDVNTNHAVSSSDGTGTGSSTKTAAPKLEKPMSKTIKPHPQPLPPSHGHFLSHGPNLYTSHDTYYQSPTTSEQTPTTTNLRNTLAPGSDSARTAADAHLAAALRDIPFEETGGTGGSGYPTGGQSGGIAGILYGSYGGQDGRGQDFVKIGQESKFAAKRGVGGGFGGSGSMSSIGGSRSRGSGGSARPVFLPELLLKNLVVGLHRLGADVSWIYDLLPSVFADELSVAGKGATSDSASAPDDHSGTRRSDDSGSNDDRALHHLIKASELGNPLAQTMIAQSLASGILPIETPTGSKNRFAGNLTVPADFSDGGAQLSRALILWHSAAMGGSVEAALALGFRSKYSAGMGKHDENKYVVDAILRRAATADKIAEYKRSGMNAGLAALKAHREEAESNRNTAASSSRRPTDSSDDNLNSKSLKDETTPATLHPNTATAHYGLLGTCESALAYYEAAAHLTMDELEASELRGKVNPARDNHRLPVIHAHGGASSALNDANKPDELEEALQYYRLRAYATPEPDISAAYTLAQLYHHGIRGVKQDMSLALEYYTIAAEQGLWEAAGQAGKFHLWGMGVNETQRDLNLAYRYFKMGSPGGVEGCRRRWKGRRSNKNSAQAARRKKQRERKKQRKAARAAAEKREKKNARSGQGSNDVTDDESDDEVEEEEVDEMWDNLDQCDHPAVNGMGLLYLFGVPMVLPPSREVATKYFELARDMGNMDASYNLAMMKLGWTDDIGARMNLRTPPLRKEFTDSAKQGVFLMPQESLSDYGLKKADYTFVVTELNRAMRQGHIQAKHRLAMLLSKGVTIVNPHLAELAGPDKLYKATDVVIARNCPLALTYYKSIAESGFALSRRIRAAYKQYVAGDYISSLRNYLAAAESGSIVAQVNAAFLLEKGTCLGLNPTDCTNAAVRMWRAAARQGDVEACLRIGDFHYYGRLLGSGNGEEDRKKSKATSATENNGKTSTTKSFTSTARLPGSEYKFGYSIGPYPWIRYVLYPEDLIVLLRKRSVSWLRAILNRKSPRNKGTSETEAVRRNEQTCPSGLEDTDGTCSARAPLSNQAKDTSELHVDHDHMALAARYYRMAAEEHDSARANFNLGFMHQWGLGLKQDFPLAKRHYDLAAASKSGEAELAVQFALMAMSWHEQIVKWRHAFDEWKEAENGHDGSSLSMIKLLTLRGAHLLRNHVFGEDTSQTSQQSKATVGDIIIAHMLSWDTLIICLICLVIARLLTDRQERAARAPRR